MQAQGAVVRAAVEELADLLAWARQSTEPALSSATWLRCTPGGGFQPVVASRPQHKLPVIFGLGLARGLHITEPEVLEAVMNRTVQTVSFKSAMPALALGAVLMLFGPTAALAQRGGGGRGGHSGGAVSGRSFSGGGGRSYSAPAPSGRRYSGSARSYAAPYAGRGYSGGRSYYGGGYSGGGYHGGGAYYPGRFYPGRGYYWGGSFWARPYFGIGIGIPFGWGYYSGSGCGYYDGYGYWQPAPCYPNPYLGY